MNATPVTLLQQFWDGELPVKVDQIAKAAGLRLQRSFGGIEGKYSGSIQQHDDGGYEISFDMTESPVRQRFTIAHELGHWALGHLDMQTRCFRDGPSEFSSNVGQQQERDANNFAAQLLMPDTLVKYAIDTKGIRSLQGLANLFNVSQAAMTYRLRNLGLLDV